MASKTPPINLYMERAELRLSRSAAAKQIGVSQDTLRRAEGGANVLLENAYRIASFYGLEVEEIWPAPTPTGAAA